MEQFYERLKQAWIDRSYTRKELSQISGIPEATMNSWSRRLAQPSGHNLLTLSKLLHVSPFYLLYGEEDKSYIEGLDIAGFLTLSPEQKTTINDLIHVFEHRNLLGK